MTEQKQNQNLAEIARKKRYLHLIEKLHGGTALSKQEIKELEDFEAEPLGDTAVKTIEEVAKIMEVNWRTVYRWKRDGMPVTKDGYYDLEEIKKWYDGKTGNTDGEIEGKIYWETKLRKYKASLLELELKRVTGELLPRDEVEEGRIARIIAIKRAFLALPTRLAPVLAMKEPREIEVELYEAISEIIDEFAGVRNDHKKTRQKDLDGGGETGVEASGKDNSKPMG